MGGQAHIVLGAYVLPLALAFALSFAARSRVARAVLRWGPAVFGTGLLLSLAAEADCERAEMFFYGCGFFSEGAADALSILQILTVIGYVTAGPMLLLISGIAEIAARRRG